MQPLQDITLAAIVRNERHNPLGGIRFWLQQVLPYVPHAVVVDTGSTDGTVRELHKARATFPHLQVYEHPFWGFADARNHSLRYVETKKTLVLDADEILLPEDFESLGKFMTEKTADAYAIPIRHLQAEGCAYETILEVMNPRIFQTHGSQFTDSDCWGEDIACEHYTTMLDAPVTIKHFLPYDEDLKAKKEWYKTGIFLQENKSNSQWKRRVNPWHFQYFPRQQVGIHRATLE